jgi:TPR repeat protein
MLYDKGEGVQQDNDMALLHYKAAVEKNNPAAQYILAKVYYSGRLGRQRNLKESIRLVTQAALAGFPEAQRVLGHFYKEGSIVPLQENRLQTIKNEREAIRWFRRAAIGKDVISLGILGKCHELGTGVDIDLEKALVYYARAAEIDSPFVCNAHIDQALLLQGMGRDTEAFRIYKLVIEIGDPVKDLASIQMAQLCVARYYVIGNIDGIPYDPVLAHDMFLKLAETSNNPHVHYWLGCIYEEGVPGIFAIDHQKAFHHFSIAADAGDNDATVMVTCFINRLCVYHVTNRPKNVFFFFLQVACMMSNHVIPEKGPADAFPWFQKAAIKGHPKSMYSLGLCFYRGLGHTPNLETALEWFEKSARLGVSDALPYMSRIYLQFMVANANEPQVAQQHFVKAVHCLMRSAENNDTYAQRELGKIYLTGKGLTADYHLAVNLLGKAAAKNDAEAITFLGHCYRKGTGVEMNMDIAMEHYLRAVTLGFP